MKIDQAYKDIFDFAPSAGIITDTASIILQVNQCAEALFQYSREQLIGKPMDFIIPLHSIEKYNKRHEGMLNVKYVDEFLAKRKNGTEFTVELSSVLFESQDMPLISWTALDISKTKNLLADLKERTKERLTLLSVTEALFNAESIEGIFSKSLQYIAEGWQYPDHTAVRVKLEDGSEFKTNNFIETQWRMEAPMIFNEKKYGLLEVYYTIEFPYYHDSPFLNEERELINVLAKLFSLFVDQWHVTKMLKDKEALIRKITEQIPGNSYQFELDKTGKIKFLFASKGISINNIGVTKEQMRDNPDFILSLIHPKDWNRFQQNMKSAYANTSDIDIHYRILSNGAEFWRWLRATAETDDGKTIWYGYTQDITPIINYIEVLEQILFDISHVMRKPIATMLGLTDVIHDHEKMDEKTLQDFTKHIRTVAYEIDAHIKKLNDAYVEKRNLLNTATGKTLFKLLAKETD